MNIGKDMEHDVVVITSTSTGGSRDAVETAIGISKGSRSSTWESNVRSSWDGIKQWDHAIPKEQKAARQR